MKKKRYGWTFTEEKILRDNYNDKTIKELEVLLSGRSREAINNKIKRLKARGKITSSKSNTAVRRSYDQRGTVVSSVVVD